MFKTLIALTATTALCAFGLYQIPKLQQAKITRLMEDSGFSNLHYTIEKSGLNGVVLSGVALDPDGISTIKQVIIKLPVFGLFGPAINSITLNAPDIIASLNANNQIIIDGWDYTNLKHIFARAPQSLTINKAELSILTANWGAITLKLDVNASREKEGQYEFQSNFDSRQKYVTAIGNSSGVISKDLLSADIEVETGKVEIPERDIRVSRLSGQGNITFGKNQSLAIIGELRAGGMQTGPLPWHNISGTLTLTDEKTEAYIGGTSLGVEGLELSGSYQNNASKVTINAPNNAALEDYLSLNKTGEEKVRAFFKDNLNAEIDFQ